MHASARKCAASTLCAAVLLCLAGCSNFDLANPLSSEPAPATATASGAPVNAWTTPPGPGVAQYPARPAPAASLQPAPQAIGSSAPRATVWRGSGLPPPPPPPDASLPVVGLPGQGASGAVCCPPAAAPVAAPPARTVAVAPDRVRKGCGLLCEEGISSWHVRGVLGLATFAGTDPAESCTYWGVDVGRTFCGCWGLDAYYRYNSGRFDLDGVLGLIKDGGSFHHVGAKLTYESAFSEGGRIYGWGGLGGGYFWTQDYFTDDSGAELFAEAGVGYVLSDTWRVRAGVNVHGMDTNVTRRRALLDGFTDSRFLWIIAPVIEIEADF